MKRRLPDVAFNTFNYTLFFIFTLVCVYPFYYIFIYSLSDPTSSARGNIYILPEGITLNNFLHVFRLPGISHAAFISVSRTIAGTLVTVICSSFFAYLMTRKDMPARSYIYRFMVITMYISAGLIPTYLLIKFLRLSNNFLVYIIPAALSPYFVILVKTFIEQIPASLEESAMIDGAGTMTIFYKILFPVCKPILATISVFAAVGCWNSWFDNLLYANTSSLKTLQLLLNEYLSTASNIAKNTQYLDDIKLKATRVTPMSVRMTITMVVTLPILFVYPFLQKYFVKGIMMGAIKG